MRRGAVSLRFLFRLRTTWAVVLLTFSGYLILSLKLSWLPSFLEEGLGYPPESVGTLVTLPYAIAIAAALISGYLSNVLVRRGHLGRTSRGAVSTAFLVLGGASMVGFCLVPPGPVQFVLVILAFSMNPVPFTVAVAGASDFVPKRHRPAFFGWIVALYSVAGIVAPYVLGLIVDAAADVADGYSNGFIVVGSLICVLAVVGGLVLMNPEKGMADIDAEAGRLEQLSKA